MAKAKIKIMEIGGYTTVCILKDWEDMTEAQKKNITEA